MKNYFELKYSQPNFFKLFYYIKKNNPDVLVIKNIQSAYSLQAMLLGKIFRKKIIIMMQLPKYRDKTQSGSVDWVGKIFKAKVITPVLGDRKYTNRNNNLFYLPFAIDAPDFDKKYFQNNQINILCVGKFQERKDQLILAKGINELKNNFDIKATFIGEADEKIYTEKLRQYITDNNLSEIIKLKNNIPHQEMIEFYRRYDLFVLPSWHESAAFSIVEAMAAKLAVICSDDNGTKTYIQEGINGYVFKHKDKQDLLDKIKLIIEDKNNLIKMGQKSFEIVKQNHSLEKFYQEFIKLVP